MALRDSILALRRRRFAARWFRQSATVLRRAVDVLADGSYSETYTAISPTVVCVVIPDAKASEVDEGESITTIIGVEVRMPVDSGILATDRLEIDGEMYRVITTTPNHPDVWYDSVLTERIKPE